jgi:hypothetical protein
VNAPAKGWQCRSVVFAILNSVMALSGSRLVASAEKKNLWTGPNTSQGSDADKRWILDTYRECINAVRGEKPVTTPSKFNRPL